MNIVILAAGMGKRMHSDLPKVLHRLAGRPLLAHVLATARRLKPQRIVVVYGHGGRALPDAFAAIPDIAWVEQKPQLGTGHAVLQALPMLEQTVPTLVLYGDVPLIESSTLERLLAARPEVGLAILTVKLEDPFGYGRVVRENDSIVRIVEEKDASAKERQITETNTGILVAQTTALQRWLGKLSTRNSQGEYYLTDIIAFAAREGVTIASAQPQNAWESAGINSKSQLAALERQLQTRIARELMDSGVTLSDPSRIDVRGELRCGRDVAIDIGCIFTGDVVLGDGVSVGAHCVLRDASIQTRTVIEPFSHIEGARIGANCRIGPYARLRPGAHLGESVHIGNFVEVKNSEIADESKANHLAYVGDSSVGARVNIGAGTITCNYDGAAKHRTVIEDDVHIGSDTQLVAPVRIGAGATIGAGTTIWKDVEPGTLVVNRKSQDARGGWERPEKPEK